MQSTEDSYAMNAASDLRRAEAHNSALPSVLRECVTRAVRRYLQDVGGEAHGLYDFVLGEVEKPLLREVMQWADGNQSRAAVALGMHRATLRKKLAEHDL